jgi:high-affinity Fe2+/Pb2+ permease
MLYRPPPPRAGARAVLLVMAVAMVASGLWLFVAGLFGESETNIWFVIGGGWLIGLGGDRLLE